MTTCPECGEPLQPLDVTCSACGAPRLEEQATTQPANTGSASAGPTARPTRDWTAAVVVILFAAINLGIASWIGFVFSEVWIVVLGLAAIFTQFALISVWWVFAPVSAMRRTVWGLIVGSVWYLSTAIGYAIFRSAGQLHDIWESGLLILIVDVIDLDDVVSYIGNSKEIACSLPLLLLVVQLPLWILRIWFRWRIVYRSEVATVQQPRKLRIRDVMVVTAAIAIALAVAKLGNADVRRTDVAYIGDVLIYGILFLVGATITIPPTLLVGMRRPRKPKRSWQALIAQVVLVATAFVGLSLFVGVFLPDNVGGLLSVIVAMYFVATLTIFRIFARRGFRLLTKRDDAPAKPAGRLD